MRFTHAASTGTLAATLLACSLTPNGIGEASPAQSEAAAPAIGEAPQEDSTQLAQYPGAPHEARDGMLWFSTVLSGLIRYDGEEFVTFTAKDGLAADAVRGILEDEDGTLWFPTTGGLSRYDGESLTTLTDYGDIPITYTFTKVGDHRDVWDVARDRHDKMWIATTGGVFRLDGTTFVPFPLPAVEDQYFEFGPKMVYSIYEDRSGALWFGTDGGGAVRYDGTSIVAYTEKEHGLCSDRVCSVLEDSRGDLWFGTSDGGVSRFDGTSFTTHLRSETFSKHSGWGRYMSILEDRSANVWFGAAYAGGGVYRWDGEAFRYFSTESGLGSGGVPSIRKDRSGNLWFGTTAGVYRLDGERFVNFTREG